MFYNQISDYTVTDFVLGLLSPIP